MPRDWTGWRPGWWAALGVGTAALIGVAVMLYSGTWLVIPVVIFALVSPLVTAIDLRWQVIPNRLVFPASCSVAVLGAISGIADGEPTRILAMAAGAAALFAVYLIPALIVPGAMGMGDVKLAILVGAVLGAIVWPAWLIGMLAGFIAGSVVGAVGLALKRLSLRSRVPYAPTMLVGAWAGIIVMAIRT